MAAAPGADARPREVGGWLVITRQAAPGAAATVAQRLPDGVAERARRIADALTLTAALQQERHAVLRSYLVPFLLIDAVLLGAALVLAPWLARGVVRPLEATALAANRVAAGDLAARVEVAGPGEVGALVRAFNGMVGRLDEQRRELARLEKLAAWRGMARTLAHEIKNPLTPILLAVQEASRSYRGDDPAHAAVLRRVRDDRARGGRRLRRLVASFSEFARLPGPSRATTICARSSRTWSGSTASGSRSDCPPVRCPGASTRRRCAAP